MPKKKKNEFGDMAKTAFGGALALQSTGLLTKPRTAASLVGTTEGLVGITVAGSFAGIGFSLLDKAYPFKKKG